MTNNNSNYLLNNIVQDEKKPGLYDFQQKFFK